ncbi:ABC transporter ATP-binding protein [Paenibacillus odorifer]|uniref:ABC transporter ATP-binding protein n=1 Tax=Paenibacillus odorifer TaxID=189426 RepID=UPI00289A98E7|nr:ABC transporter ATP-binding protein [Paenibacillus odorifer]
MCEEQNVLQVNDLNVSVRTFSGNLSLIQKINFSLRKGQILGLVGESGSGKTVTSAALLQLLGTEAVIKGSIKLNGRELNGLNPKEMQRIRGKEIGYIMQNPMNALTPVYTIGNQFIESIRTHSKLTRKQAFELAVHSLESVNLAESIKLMDKYPHQLSGGMLQRVMIAISMCLKPAIVIADEPTTALDVVNQQQVLRQLEQLRAECGTAILLITHDLSVIAEMADDVMVMQQGRIVEQASVFDLFDRPQHGYTKKLLHSRLDLSGYEGGL